MFAPIAFRFPILRRSWSVVWLGLLGWLRLVAGETALVETKSPDGVRSLSAPGLHNLFALGTNLYCGSSPEGDAGFASLRRLGVRTVITVDGARPELEAARPHGLRYVHLPHGYDGIAPERQLQLLQAVTTLPGPVYVHCHHGKHRGPAAAAIICRATEGWDADHAEAWMHRAGTGTNYVGLYAAVRAFRLPSAQERLVAGTLPEVAPVTGLVESMVTIDQTWERLKEVRAAGFRAPAQHPDLHPAGEATVLAEHFRETRRLADAVALGPSFVDALERAEADASELARLLSVATALTEPASQTDLVKAFEDVGRSCVRCHGEFRDSPAKTRSRP